MRLGLFSAYFTTGSSKCMSEVSMQKFASYHTNRTLDAQDFFRVNGSEQFDLTELNTLRDELNRAIQYWIIYMLEKTSKTALSNKKTFLKHLQIVVNLNKFELNEENIKLSGRINVIINRKEKSSDEFVFFKTLHANIKDIIELAVQQGCISNRSEWLQLV